MCFHESHQNCWNTSQQTTWMKKLPVWLRIIWLSGVLAVCWWPFTVEKITVLCHQSVITNNHTDADSTSTHPAPPASSHQRPSRLTLWALRCWIKLVSAPEMPKPCYAAFRVSVSEWDLLLVTWQKTERFAFVLQKAVITIITQPCSKPFNTILPATKCYLQWM